MPQGGERYNKATQARCDKTQSASKGSATTQQTVANFSQGHGLISCERVWRSRWRRHISVALAHWQIRFLAVQLPQSADLLVLVGATVHRAREIVFRGRLKCSAQSMTQGEWSMPQAPCSGAMPAETRIRLQEKALSSSSEGLDNIG